MDDVCERCRFGRISTTTACFVGKLGRHPLVVSAIPAYACDMCGLLEYDADALRTLDNLIRQPESPPTIVRPRIKGADGVSAIVSVN